MKIIAITDNDSLRTKMLVELSSEELANLTNQDYKAFDLKYTKDLVGKEYDISSTIALAKTISQIALNNEYDSLINKQRLIVSNMEKLQKPMAQLKEQLKQVTK